jgi:hypothetical protein
MIPYQAIDWLGVRREAIEDALAAWHLRDGTLVLYEDRQVPRHRDHRRRDRMAAG